MAVKVTASHTATSQSDSEQTLHSLPRTQHATGSPVCLSVCPSVCSVDTLNPLATDAFGHSPHDVLPLTVPLPIIPPNNYLPTFSDIGHTAVFKIILRACTISPAGVMSRGLCPTVFVQISRSTIRNDEEILNVRSTTDGQIAGLVYRTRS